MIRTIITLEKPVEGHKLIAQFIQDTNDRGHKEYYMYTYISYNGSSVLDQSDRSYHSFKNKDEVNAKYLEFISNGYKKIDSWTFTPTEMDADGNILEG